MLPNMLILSTPDNLLGTTLLGQYALAVSGDSVTSKIYFIVTTPFKKEPQAKAYR